VAVAVREGARVDLVDGRLAPPVGVSLLVGGNGQGRSGHGRGTSGFCGWWVKNGCEGKESGGEAAGGQAAPGRHEGWPTPPAALGLARYLMAPWVRPDMTQRCANR